MVKYYNIEGAIVKFIDDIPTVIKRDWISINNMFRITEDGILDGREVHEGDIVFTFYHTNNVAIISKDTDLSRILTEEMQKRDEKEKALCSEPDCECVKGCNPA